MTSNSFHEGKILASKVIKYLESLGYSSESLVLEYKVNASSYVDIAIFEDGKLIGIVEIKSAALLSLKNTEELPYNRIVRRTQGLSDLNKCKFFIISNGVEHVWMQTSSTGRAIKIKEIPANKSSKNSARDEKYVHAVLWRALDYLKGNSLSNDYLLDFSIALNEILRISNLGNMYETQLSEDISESISKNYSFIRSQEFNGIYNCLEILSDIKELMPKYAASVLSFVDELLIKNNREIFVPQWLSNLMYDLSVSHPNSKVVNLFARYGSFLSSASSHNPAKLNLYTSNEHLLIWCKLRAKLLGLSDSNIYYSSGLQLGQFPEESYVDTVIMAPPFNVHINNSNIGKEGNKKRLDSTFCYIKESIKLLSPDGLVAVVVPDGFLFNESSKYLRAELEKCCSVEAIISLPNETFRPYANVASSILLLRNAIHSSADREVFFGVIPSNTKDTQKKEILADLRNNYSAFKDREYFNEDSNFFIEKKLEPNNWHHSKYHYLKFSELESKVSNQFNLIPLKELSKGIYRGASFVKDDDGEIPYVSQANVREMSLNLDDLSYTSQNKIKAKFRRLELNDILVNAISNYRGSAAIVDDLDFVGLGANRHVIIIQPDINLINPYYLAVIINSELVRKQLFDQAIGSVIQSFTLNSLEDLLIPVPSGELQNEIATSYKSKKFELQQALNRAREIEVDMKDLVSNLGK